MAESEFCVVVVGGSIAGLCCAHSLLHHHRSAGCTSSLQLVVLEKAKSLTAAGAGLGLDALSCSALHLWGLSPLNHTLPLSCEEASRNFQQQNRNPNFYSNLCPRLLIFLRTFLQNRVIHGASKRAQTVARDPQYDHRAAHWSDLHRILYDSLPAETVRWGHEVISFEEAADERRVRVLFRRGDTSAIEEMEGDLLIAADGSMSETRKRFLPHEKKRYCGYCAWRGVLDASTEEGLKVKAALQEQYPDLGNCLYFDMAGKTHAVLYELAGSRLNWLWYVNQPEPNLKGSSLTSKADDEAILNMKVEASHVWLPELAALMQATPAPFINAIFDREPLEQLVWGRVVLVGEAAHPTSPHGLRSTNMSILDAAVLGQCIAKWGSQVDEALKEYQALRLPVTSQQVLFSRHLGQVKQGFLSMQLPTRLSNSLDFQWEILLQRNMHRFENNDEEQ